MSDRQEELAKALADSDANAGYNWYWTYEHGEHFAKWDELPEEDEEVEGGWLRGRNYFRRLAGVALAHETAAVQP